MEHEDRFPITKLNGNVAKEITQWLDYERIVKENRTLKKTLAVALCKCGVRGSRFIRCHECGRTVCERCEIVEKNNGPRWVEYYCSEKCLDASEEIRRRLCKE